MESVPRSVPEYKVETLYSGTGTVPFWRGYLKKRVFTLVPIKNRSRAPSVNAALDSNILIRTHLS